MNKLKASSEEAEAQVGDIGMGFDDAAMETMMKELEGLMENGDFDDAFGGVLNQLVSKELLFEPMKELADKVF
jgi:peroxin-19